ncbi:MAG: hypothetical protein QM218_01370 [Candidatus Cloacimonadota bacterium]|nr:hypothetical protein [Candidatus Cloacimonadota bacterium]
MMQYILIFSGITLVFGILIYLLIQSGLSDLSEEQEARTCLIKGDIMMHNTTLQDFADKNERQNERIALEHNHRFDHLETQLSSLHSQLVTLNSPLVTLSSSPRHSGLDPESSPSLASSERSEHGRQEPPPTHTPTRHSGLDPESTQIANLIPQLSSLIAAQKENIVKEGESRRNLYRRLQLARADVAALRRELAAQKQSNASLKANNLTLISELDAVHESCGKSLSRAFEEIRITREYIDASRIGLEKLDKRLSLHFKGKVPSEVWARNESEKQLHEKLIS